jgi:hypothetical protein
MLLFSARVFMQRRPKTVKMLHTAPESRKNFACGAEQISGPQKKGLLTPTYDAAQFENIGPLTESAYRPKIP